MIFKPSVKQIYMNIQTKKRISDDGDSGDDDE